MQLGVRKVFGKRQSQTSQLVQLKKVNFFFFNHSDLILKVRKKIENWQKAKKANLAALFKKKDLLNLTTTLS